MTSNFTATVQQIRNCSAFNEDVFNWFMTVEEHIFSFSKLVYYWIITNRCVLWKAIGINSIKTKDFTECKFEATRHDLMTSSNKKGFFWFWLLWIFKSFPDVKIYIVWIYSQVKWFCFCFFFYRQEWCINMVKVCNVLSCLKLNFLPGTITILCQKIVCNVFLLFLEGCMFMKSVHVLWFCDNLFYTIRQDYAVMSYLKMKEKNEWLDYGNDSQNLFFTTL